MIELDAWGWAVLAFAAACVGLSKTGVPGLMILAAPLLAGAMDAKMSVGVLLPMLLVGDAFAVAYYRRHTQWNRLLPLLPWTAAGIAAGFLVLRALDGGQLRPIIGWSVLAMVGVMAWRAAAEAKADGGEGPAIPEGRWFAALCGIAAGVVTTVANAAGPVMFLYLIAMRLPKHEFVGTAAWFFLIVNLAKVPLYAAEGMITWGTLGANAVVAPLIAAGALLGYKVLKRLPEAVFKWSVVVLSGLAALRLLLA